ncbi:MAG: hypothetical protein A2498_07125 [Lentisphaerae bacterium RIFOXYC12_FULL_60_16]|nr:MAG: hypothetical protein A2498_07125 [Lentisphaerae bacterium RIFOXYC12_FULL_60_16]OGV78935.1 MAG: hypothetical protein A2340_03300 [Lentisphaerae bacterium RIFOXYB12_FULL_60_10]
MMNKIRIAICGTVLAITCSVAQDYSNVAYCVGSSGLRMTNLTMVAISSWGQQFRPTDSLSTGYLHRSGFIHVLGIGPWADTDNDGIPDEDDTDNDNDGLSDTIELTGSAFSPATPTDPNKADTDCDGLADSSELIAGTDPNSATSVLAMAEIRDSTTAIVIQVATVPGRRYELVYSSCLTNTWSAFWNTNASIYKSVASTCAVHVFLDDFTTNTSGSVPEHGLRFYRVRLSSP